MSLAADLHKLGSRSWKERALLLEALALLGLMRAAILMFPFRAVARAMGLAPVQNPPAEALPAGKAADIGRAVLSAASRTPWKSACLVQALAGMVMLRSRGMRGVLYLGVAKDATVPEGVAAHAWLALGDATVTGARGQRLFTTIASFSWARTRSGARSPNTTSAGP